MMKSNLFMMFVLAVIFAGCNAPTTTPAIGKPDNFDYGHMQGDKYVNSFFNFEMTLPQKWIVQNKEQRENLTKMGKKMAGGSDNLQASMKASEINSANLLTAYKYEPGSPVESNPCIILVVENVSFATGIKTGKDYLFQAKRVLESTQIEYSHIDSDFKKEVINGIDFYTMNAEVEILELNVTQTYFSTIINGFSFNIIITYTNEEEKAELVQSLNSMKFKK